MSPKKMIGLSFAAPAAKLYEIFDKPEKPPRRWRGGFVSDDQIFVTILMPGPMVDAVTQDLMYWPFAAAGLALMIAPMSAS